MRRGPSAPVAARSRRGCDVIARGVVHDHRRRGVDPEAVGEVLLQALGDHEPAASASQQLVRRATRRRADPVVHEVRDQRRAREARDRAGCRDAPWSERHRQHDLRAEIPHRRAQPRSALQQPAVGAAPSARGCGAEMIEALREDAPRNAHAIQPVVRRRLAAGEDAERPGVGREQLVQRLRGAPRLGGDGRLGDDQKSRRRHRAARSPASDPLRAPATGITPPSIRWRRWP